MKTEKFMVTWLATTEHVREPWLEQISWRWRMLENINPKRQLDRLSGFSNTFSVKTTSRSDPTTIMGSQIDSTTVQ